MVGKSFHWKRLRYIKVGGVGHKIRDRHFGHSISDFLSGADQTPMEIVGLEPGWPFERLGCLERFSTQGARTYSAQPAKREQTTKADV